jgi:hypothetical protein
MQDETDHTLLGLVQVVEDILRVVGSVCKVVAVRMPPPPSPPTCPTGGAVAAEPAGDQDIPVAATAAVSGSELEQGGPGGQTARLEPWEVIAAGKS